MLILLQKKVFFRFPKIHALILFKKVKIIRQKGLNNLHFLNKHVIVNHS